MRILASTVKRRGVSFPCTLFSALRPVTGMRDAVLSGDGKIRMRRRGITRYEHKAVPPSDLAPHTEEEDDLPSWPIDTFEYNTFLEDGGHSLRLGALQEEEEETILSTTTASEEGEEPVLVEVDPVACALGAEPTVAQLAQTTRAALAAHLIAPSPPSGATLPLPVEMQLDTDQVGLLEKLYQQYYVPSLSSSTALSGWVCHHCCAYQSSRTHSICPHCWTPRWDLFYCQSGEGVLNKIVGPLFKDKSDDNNNTAALDRFKNSLRQIIQQRKLPSHWVCNVCYEYNLISSSTGDKDGEESSSGGACRCCHTARNKTEELRPVVHETFAEELIKSDIGTVMNNRNRVTRWRCLSLRSVSNKETGATTPEKDELWMACREQNSLKASHCRLCASPRFSNVWIQCAHCLFPYNELSHELCYEGILYDEQNRMKDFFNFEKHVFRETATPNEQGGTEYHREKEKAFYERVKHKNYPFLQYAQTHPTQKEEQDLDQQTSQFVASERQKLHHNITNISFHSQNSFAPFTPYLRCLQCHSFLHGSEVSTPQPGHEKKKLNFSNAFWWCACGVVNSAVGISCTRCRLPRHVMTASTNQHLFQRLLYGEPHRDAPPQVFAQPLDLPSFRNQWDFHHCTSWYCDYCTTVNTASCYVVQAGGKGKMGAMYHGDRKCRRCDLPWHGLITDEQGRWRCACHQVNEGSTTHCTSCGLPQRPSLRVDTLSMWCRGDWVCARCDGHNYRDRQKCSSCGSEKMI